MLGISFRAFDFLTDEKWQDEIVPTKICFANQIANGGPCGVNGGDDERAQARGYARHFAVASK